VLLPPTETESKATLSITHTADDREGTQCNYQKTWKHSDSVHSILYLLLYICMEWNGS
jgi:hypothetical protein